ncbi:hypothetical protein Peur_033195 [Populus x canadensis]
MKSSSGSQTDGWLKKKGVKLLQSLSSSWRSRSVVPLTGTRTLVNGLVKGLRLNTTVPYRTSFQGKQVAGWTQVYGDILSFATIRGASHGAPFSQPKRSIVLFNAFLEGKQLPQAL